MSGGGWLGKIKSQAKSVQETAKNRLDKLSETLDNKIKEAREDLEKQRLAEASGPAAPKVQRWRASTDNPDGEIIAAVAPTPVEQPPEIQPLPQAPPPESQETLPAVVEEPITILRRSKDKRRATKKSEQKDTSIKQNDNNEELVLSLDNAVQQSVDRDVKDKDSNVLNDKESTNTGLVQNTTVVAISQKEELIPAENLTSHPETTVDIQKKEFAPSETDLQQGIIQPNVSADTSMPSPNNDNPPINHSRPVDTPADEKSTSTNTGSLPIENADPQSVVVDKSSGEEPVLTDIEHSSKLDARSESMLNKDATDEQPTSTNTDSVPTEHADPQSIVVDKFSDKEPVLTDIEHSSKLDARSESMPNKETTDEQPTSTNTDSLPIEYVDLQSTSVDRLSDEEPIIMDIEHSSNLDSLSESIPLKDTTDEQPTSSFTDSLPIEHTDPQTTSIDRLSDEEPDLTDIEHSSNLDSRSESMPIKEPTDEILTSTNIDNLVVEHVDPTNNEDKISDNEPTIEHSVADDIPTNMPEDESPTVTDTDDLPKVHPDSEKIPEDTSADIVDTPVEHSDLENIQTDIPNSKAPTFTDNTDQPIVEPNSENISIDVPTDEFLAATQSHELAAEQFDSDDELPTATKIDEFSKQRSNSEKLSQDKPNEESLVEHTDPENGSTEVLEDKLPVSTNIVDISTADPNQKNILEDILNDELSASIESDKSSTKHADHDENISINTPVDTPSTSANLDDASKIHSNPENISQDTSDDELPNAADIANSLNAISASENILMNIPDDELPSLTDIEHHSNTKPDSENLLMNIPDDALPTTTDIITSLNTSSDSENILMSIPDDELPTIEDIADVPIVISTAENILMNIPDGELPTIIDIDNSPIIESTLKTSSKTPTDTKLTNVDEIPIAHSSPKSVSINKRNDGEVLKSTTVQGTSIEKSKLKDELPTSTNELEDSFEELKASDIPVQRAPEPPAQKPPPQEQTQLTSLRALLSKIEDTDDDDDDLFSLRQSTSISQKNVLTTHEPSNAPKLLATTISSSSSSTSISDDAPDDLFGNSSVPSHSVSDLPSVNSANDTISTLSIETKPAEKKRSSIVNSHSIPAGTKIQRINCSSTYIYLCTTDRKIFYAKLNQNNLNDPFKWQQHTDLAEQLVVSESNQTVWRLHNKTLYTANDPIKSPPIGSQWNKIKMNDNQSFLSISINDQCGWYIKDDGTLWLLRADDKTFEPFNVSCPFNLNTVFCFSEKVGVSTTDGEILIRAGCTREEPEGGGWIFIEHNFGPIDDFVLLTSNDMIVVVDKKHHLWMHQRSSEKGFYEILCDDDFYTSNERYLVSVNSDLLCFTDCQKQIHLFSDCLAGVQWTVVEKNTRLQRLIGAFSNEDYVWALTTDRRISSSKGKVFEKPRQAQYLTHATFVPINSSQNTVLWSLDESCGAYVRPNIEDNTEWEQANQTQFEWSRRLINIVCSNVGVWAVDDEGNVHFRHGHISASQNSDAYGATFLPPAWIKVPGEPKRNRSFTQVYCGPADWMVYATDNKQNVYTRVDINEENRVGTCWKAIEDCSALELAISEHTLWLLTSCGEIQCRENISLSHPIGTRSTTLSGFFRSLTVSMDDSQVWALDSQRNLLKLDRLTVLFEK